MKRLIRLVTASRIQQERVGSFRNQSLRMFIAGCRHHYFEIFVYSFWLEDYGPHHDPSGVWLPLVVCHQFPYLKYSLPHELLVYEAVLKSA